MYEKKCEMERKPFTSAWSRTGEARAFSFDSRSIVPSFSRCRGKWETSIVGRLLFLFLPRCRAIGIYLGIELRFPQSPKYFVAFPYEAFAVSATRRAICFFYFDDKFVFFRDWRIDDAFFLFPFFFFFSLGREAGCFFIAPRPTYVIRVTDEKQATKQRDIHTYIYIHTYTHTRNAWEGEKLVCVSVCVHGKGRHDGRKFVIVINAGLNKVQTERERKRGREWRVYTIKMKIYARKCEKERENRNLARIAMCVLYKIYSLQLFVMDTFYLSNKS